MTQQQTADKANAAPLRVPQMVHKKRSFKEQLAYIFAPEDAKGLGFFDRLVSAGEEDAWRARPEVPAEKRLLDVIAGQSQRKGQAPPTLIIYKSPKPNAYSNLLNGSLGVGTNLMSITTPSQMETILAHEMAHHGHRLRDALAGVGNFIGVCLGYNKLIKPHLEKCMPGNATGKLAFWTAEQVGIAAAIVYTRSAYTRAIEFQADHESGVATGKPKELIGALEALSKRGKELQEEEAKTHQAKHKYVAAKPVKGGWMQVISDTAQELEPQWVRKIRKDPASLLKGQSHPPHYQRFARLNALDAQLKAETHTNIAMSR